DREDASIFSRVNLESAASEHLDDLDVGQPVARRPEKSRFVRPESSKQVLDRPIVGDVAFPAPGDEDLGANPRSLFEQQNLRAELRRPERGHDPSRPRSNDDHSRHSKILTRRPPITPFCFGASASLRPGHVMNTTIYKK